MEVCLTSNLQTITQLEGDIKNHPIRQMFENHLSVCLGTDNRLVSHTTVTQETRKCVDAFGLNPKQLKDLVLCGFESSFFPGPYHEKRAYIDAIRDYYEHLEQQHGVVSDLM